jgi:hypothetical protein
MLFHTSPWLTLLLAEGRTGSPQRDEVVKYAHYFIILEYTL